MALIILCVVLLVIFWMIGKYIFCYNALKKYSNKVDESLSGIDVALSKRHEVLTKMIEIVKGYMKYEKEVLFNIIKLRNNMSIDDLKEVDNLMDDDFHKIDVTVENYPDIKADEQFKLLQKSVIDSEEHLQAARRIYNASVLKYNQLIDTFPSLIVARINGDTKREFFKAKDDEKDLNINL